MFTRIFNFGNINVIPLCYVRSESCTLVPIKGDQVLAQARVGGSIHNVQTETKLLVRMDLQIYILRIHFTIEALQTRQLVEQTANNVWSYQTQIKTCRNWQCHLSTCCIFAIRNHTDGHMSSLATLVSQIET